MATQTVTIDLSGLELSEEQFKELQSALHQTALAHVSKLPAFVTEGISIRPVFPIGGGGGGIINGIVVDRLRQIGGVGGQ